MTTGTVSRVRSSTRDVVEQPPDQGAAAMDLQLASRLGIELANGGRDLIGEDGRVRPPRS
jgi:hypothetical protein